MTYDKIYFTFANYTSVACTSNLYQSSTCDFLRQGQLYIRGISQSDIQPGTLLSISMNNCLLDVDQAVTTKSWDVVTMTADGYMIDRVSKGMTLTFPCNLPCQTCKNGLPKVCTSCNGINGEVILWNGRCIKQCPDGMYTDEYGQC